MNEAQISQDHLTQLAEIERQCLMKTTDHLKTESYSQHLYLLLRYTYVKTDGLFNEYLNSKISFSRPLVNVEINLDSLFDKSSANLITNQIISNGGYYSIRPSAEIDYSELCNALDSSKPSSKNSRRRFINDHSKLLGFSSVSQIVFDPSIRFIADQYLNCSSILNSVCAWKTTSLQGDENLDSDAMLWHFDSDHNRFLKVFIYLDDVEAIDGPHMYIPNTARLNRSNMPIELKQDARITNLQVANHGLLPQYVLGSAGTFIFADTHNLHRGTPVHPGRSRYLLQLQFVDSIFGADTQFNEEKYIQLNPNL